MIVVRTLLAASLSILIILVHDAAGAADRCLSRAEQRAHAASHAVVPLARALRAVKARRGELVRASLCERSGQLVYVLTLLTRDGKVARATVDAASGAVIGR